MRVPYTGPHHLKGPFGRHPLTGPFGPYEYIHTDAARMQRAERRARLDCNSHKTGKHLHIIHATLYIRHAKI